MIPLDFQTYFLYRAVYFGMYDTIRITVEKDKKNLPFFASFLIAQGVSIFSAYLTYPWDTVRRRMMIKGSLSTKRAFGAAKRIVVEEGVRGLFKGALANIFRYVGFKFFR
ncbi:ADP/ATP translocase 1 domain protein [Cooperia oncophora]